MKTIQLATIPQAENARKPTIGRAVLGAFSRYGYELVASINDQVGKLLRTYVAEAIEREIAQWRDDKR